MMCLVDDGVTLSVQPLVDDSCASYAGSLGILLGESDVGTLDLIQLAFAAPTPEEAGSWVVGGFAAVLGAYVLGRMVGSVVAMFK